jgi:outer membrane receptor protein involved in Fe transport
MAETAAPRPSLHMRRSAVTAGAEPDAGAAAVPPADDAVADPASSAPAASPTPAASSAPAAASAPARFVVTGSLIPRATQTTPSPVTILRRDQLLAQGRTMIGDVLQSLPAHGNGLNAQFNNGGDGSTRIDLRSLGQSRTLTLLDGRRISQSGNGADASVDLNTIPLAAIDRVEILRDAGSEVYGSDAIGGVVNVITRSTFTGSEASLYTGQSDRRDGFTYDASVITGHRSDDGRAHLVFAAETQQQDPVQARDREFSARTFSFDFTCTPEMEAAGLCVARTLTGSSSAPNGRINTVPPGGPRLTIPGCTTRFCTADGHGGFRNFIPPTATSFGDNYNFQEANYLYTPSSRTSVYTAGSFQLTPDARGFFDAGFQHRDSQQQLAPLPLTLGLFGTPISRNSIYNPFGVDVVDYNRRLVEDGPRAFQQGINTMHVAVGLRGDAKTPDDWSWELSYRYSRSDATEHRLGQLVRSRLASALGPSFVDPSSGPTCGTPSRPIFGCVPLNLLSGAGSASPEALAYVGFTGTVTGADQEQTLLASAQRRLVSLPGGGDTTLAVTADVRKDKGDLTPDSLAATGDTTDNAIPAVHGSVKAAEVAAELQTVLLRDPDGVERLELDLAARAFRYDTFEGGINASARALVRPVRGITLRASRSAAFHAPSIPELFSAQSDSFPFASDPCDSRLGPPDPRTAAECARQGVPAGSVFGTSQQRATVGGNPNLRPEKAMVTTAGVVLEAPRAPGLSLSVDLWRIELSDSVTTFNINNVFNSCYQGGIAAFCDLIQRDSRTHQISHVDLRNTNAGGITTTGVDAAINLHHHLPGLGDLHARAELQQLDTYDLDTGTGTTLHGVGVYDLGVLPRRKASVSAVLQRPHVASAGFNIHFIDSFQECDQNDCNDGNPSRTVDAYTQLDVFGSLTFRALGGETTLAVGINNVTDVTPPAIFNGAAANFDTSAYDVLGRFTYLRLTQAF